MLNHIQGLWIDYLSRILKEYSTQKMKMIMLFKNPMTFLLLWNIKKLCWSMSWIKDWGCQMQKQHKIGPYD